MRKAAWARNPITSRGSSHTKGSGYNAAGEGGRKMPPTRRRAREKGRVTRSLDLRQNSTPLTANHTLVAATSRVVSTRSNLLTTMLTMKYASERTNVAHQRVRARRSQCLCKGVPPAPGWSVFTPVSVEAEGSSIGTLLMLVSCSYLWSIGLRSPLYALACSAVHCLVALERMNSCKQTSVGADNEF